MKIKDSIATGVIMGLLSMVVALIIYYFMKFSGYTEFSFNDFLYFVVVRKNTFVPIVIFSIINVALFYRSVNRQQYQTNRGILITFFVSILALIIIKFVV